jgi:hypothetical protein
MDDTINEKTINKRFNAKESNYKTSAPIVGNSLESRIFASRHDIDKIKDLLTSNNIDLSTLNEEYIKSFNDLYTQYNSMNEELKDIVKEFKSNIEYKKFFAEDSPFIFDKEFFEKWNLSEDKTEFTLTKLTKDFLNKEIEFEFKVKNVGFSCQKNIIDYIAKNNIAYTIKYYINDEEVSSFVKEYKREDYGKEIKFKVIFLISSISSENNNININYNFFKQFATTNNNSKFYLTFNKLTDFFDINFNEEDQNVLNYSDENKQITFVSGYKEKTSEGIEDVIEEKDENINISGNKIYSSNNSNSSITEKIMDLQSNIDDEKIIGIENHPLDNSVEVVDGIKIKGNENNEDITLTVKDKIVDTHLSFVNMPNYIGKIEDQSDSSISENNSDEFLKKLEVRNTSFIDTINEKFPLYSSNTYTHKPVNLLLPATINMNNGGGRNVKRGIGELKLATKVSPVGPGPSIDIETPAINLKDYMEVQEFNNFTRLIIKDPKYFNYYNFGISSKFGNSRNCYYIDVKGNNKVYFTNYNGSQVEYGKRYRLYSNDNQHITINYIDYLQFPIERPVTSEYVQDNEYQELYDFIRNSSYWSLLSDDERNILNDFEYSSMSEEEKGEFIIELYNKYEVDNSAIIDIYEEDYSSSSSSTIPFYYDKIDKVKIKFRFVYDASINKNEFIKYFDNYKNSFYINRHVFNKSGPGESGGMFPTPKGSGDIEMPRSKGEYFAVEEPPMMRLATKVSTAQPPISEDPRDPTDFDISHKSINFEITDQLQEAEIDFSDLECNENQNISFYFGFSGPNNFNYYGVIIEEIKVYVGSNNKMENVFVKNENIGSEEYKMIELNTPRINKLSFNYSEQNQNSEIIETEIEKHLINENQIHISEGISDDTLNKNEKNEYSVLISNTSKQETTFEINIPSGNNKIEFEINPFSVNVIDEPIEDPNSTPKGDEDYPVKEAVEEWDEEPKKEEVLEEIEDDPDQLNEPIDKFMAFYLNDSTVPFLTINPNSEYRDNEWQIISLLLNENIENKIIVKLFNYNNNYFEQISNMPIIRNIYYYNENTNEKIIEETDIEKMSGISLVNGAIIISNPGAILGGSGGGKDIPRFNDVK